MTPDEIDKILAKAANQPLSPSADRAAMEQIERGILGELSRVRPLASERVFMLGFVALFAAAAVTSASALGLHGIHALSGAQDTVIFPLLLVAVTLAAWGCAREMAPGGGTRLGAWALAFALVALPAAFFVIFPDRRMGNFVTEGIPCLVAGLAVAIPTGVVTAWILRRGYVLDWSAAGIAAGALSGLAGLGMLELHCPNLKVFHVVAWHGAVVLVGGILGFILGKIGQSKFARFR
jgi:hypothetical protein